MHLSKSESFFPSCQRQRLKLDLCRIASEATDSYIGKPTAIEQKTWKSFVFVVESFFGNHKAGKFKKLGKNSQCVEKDVVHDSCATFSC